MKKGLRKTIVCCFVLLFLLNLFNISPIHALSNTSDVLIDAKESKVVNLIYHVVDENGQNYPYPIEFNLIDKDSGNVIKTESTNDSILIFSNINFGNYIIAPASNSYWGKMYVKANADYINTQHIIKRYVIFTNKTNFKDQIDLGNGQTKFIEKTVKTGDDKNVTAYIISSIFSLIGFTYINKVRKEQY